MDEYEIPFINACIRKFSKRIGVGFPEGFKMLDKFGAVDFLTSYYPGLHLQSIDDTVDDLIQFCKNKGGFLS